MQAITALPESDSADRRPRAAAIALLVSAGAICIAAVTKAWFYGYEGGVGLLGVEHCRGGSCELVSWYGGYMPAAITLSAAVAVVATFVFVAFAIHGAAVLLRGAPNKVMLRLLDGALGLAALGMLAFLISVSVMRSLALGWSGVVGLGGALAAAIVTGTMIRPLSKET